jgi:hypothetical protein
MHCQLEVFRRTENDVECRPFEGSAQLPKVRPLPSP